MTVRLRGVNAQLVENLEGRAVYVSSTEHAHSVVDNKQHRAVQIRIDGRSDFRLTFEDFDRLATVVAAVRAASS